MNNLQTSSKEKRLSSSVRDGDVTTQNIYSELDRYGIGLISVFGIKKIVYKNVSLFVEHQFSIDYNWIHSSYNSDHYVDDVFYANSQWDQNGNELDIYLSNSKLGLSLAF